MDEGFVLGNKLCEMLQISKATLVRKLSRLPAGSVEIKKFRVRGKDGRLRPQPFYRITRLKNQAAEKSPAYPTVEDPRKTLPVLDRLLRQTGVYDR